MCLMRVLDTKNTLISISGCFLIAAVGNGKSRSILAPLLIADVGKQCNSDDADYAAGPCSRAENPVSKTAETACVHADNERYSAKQQSNSRGRKSSTGLSGERWYMKWAIISKISAAQPATAIRNIKSIVNTFLCEFVLL